MRFFSFILAISFSSLAFSVEKSPVRQESAQVAFTHTELFNKAASDLRVRQLQKLVEEENWNRKDKFVKKSAANQ